MDGDRTLIFITSPPGPRPRHPNHHPTPPHQRPGRAEDPADCKATLEALKKKIEAQDRRIAELEAKQGDDQKMRRAEIIAVLKEMNLLNDKKAGDMRVYYKEGLKV